MEKLNRLLNSLSSDLKNEGAQKKPVRIFYKNL